MSQNILQLFPASIDDCLDISTSFRSAAEITDWGGEGFVYPVQHHQFLLQLHRPDTCCFVLKMQHDVLGFGQICQRFGRHHLARLLILPEARGKRLSYPLILSLICRALQQNRKLDFSLFVFRHNHQAIHCYQKLGFKISEQLGPEHPGLYFMQLSAVQAMQILETASWQCQLHSEFVSCRLKEVSNADLD